MDLWQSARQFAEKLLAAARWEDSPQDLVLTGGAFVSEDLEGNLLTDVPPSDRKFVLPFARVQPIAFDEDPESPGRGVARLRVFVVAGGGGIAGAAGTNDSHGINQETGANRATSTPQGKSDGRSTDEVVSRLVESALGITNLPGALVDSIHGLQGRVVGYGPRIAVDGVQVLARPFDIEIPNASVKRYYHPVFFASGAKVAATNVLSWSAAPARFDTWASPTYIVRRGATAGAAAPTTPTGGVSIPVTGVTATDPAPATGVNNYSIFVGYTETPAAVTANTPDRYSDKVTVAVTF